MAPAAQTTGTPGSAAVSEKQAIQAPTATAEKALALQTALLWTLQKPVVKVIQLRAAAGVWLRAAILHRPRLAKLSRNGVAHEILPACPCSRVCRTPS